jgi:hypothetical protein
LKVDVGEIIHVIFCKMSGKLMLEKSFMSTFAKCHDMSALISIKWMLFLFATRHAREIVVIISYETVVTRFCCCAALVA